MYSLFQRLVSHRYRVWLRLSERARRSRGPYREMPAHDLPAMTPEQSRRIAVLQRTYQAKFEATLTAATSIKNYEYLDVLDRGFTAGGLGRPAGGVVCDVGCANFWYAQALQGFFRPASLVGMEVEGYRLYRDGHTRIDYAAGYLADMPNARFEVADYLGADLRADVITAWFPFVTATAILAWRLPLSLLRPEALFLRIRRNLNADGMFVMVNHGSEEAARAAALCDAAGLRRLCEFVHCGALSAYRPVPPVLSCWRA